MLTIHNAGGDSVKQASALALGALGWVLGDQPRAQRFLDLTGLTPDGLRAAIGEESTHRAVFEFLLAHEPDLLGAAEALDLPPEQLAAAARELAR
ncbi:MAG: DUF3572 family protein [Erythrobacter sp.]|nr:DUF3572 family protein [Erythrobacter sp.]